MPARATTIELLSRAVGERRLRPQPDRSRPNPGGTTFTRRSLNTARRAALIGCVAAGALGAGVPSASAANHDGVTSASAANHDCFWLGPISTNQRSAGPEHFDGRYFNYPEESATYWLARYRLKPGQKLVLNGRYPHARYESLNSYQQGGTPAFTLPDISIHPDRGSINPFIAGAPRDLRRRDWSVTVVDQPAPIGPALRNTLYAPSTSSFASELLLRVYMPDRGRDLTGDVGLPTPQVINANGTRVHGLTAACAAINDPDRSIAQTVQSIPISVWQSLVNTPGPRANPATSPALDPPQWERFFNQAFVAGIFQQAAGNPRPLAGQSDTGGFYSNKDSRYLITFLSGIYGKVVVIHARMPLFPNTYDGALRMPSAQVRFWSLCSGESRVTTFTPDCVADRQVPLEGHRDYTIVVSKPADRPSNARPQCGIAWLNWGLRGDDAGRPNFGFLIMRNMLASPTFDQAIQNIHQFGDEKRVMGPYFPSTTYTTKRAFERLGCNTHS
jgi:hypothetical protein